MKLTLRTYRDQFGNDLPLLCDEAGIALPGQCRVTLTHANKELPRVTVEFEVDGKRIQSLGMPIKGRDM